MDIQKYDVIISGGGLAGLTLALQLNNMNPNIRVVIVERNCFPVPATTAKVGESTVEIGSHYLSHVLGLKEHLQKHHLRKFGLRCYFGRESDDFSSLDELGVSDLFGVPSYQIERGTLENYLHQHLCERGVSIIDGAQTLHIDVQSEQHTLTFKKADAEHTIASRWLIDAAGRHGLLKSTLNLSQPSAHKGNAVFFRINKTIMLDKWSDDAAWQTRIKEQGKRWLSTNHLMGPGYWVWVIPLASGATSIGIVFDDQVLAESNLVSFEHCMAWLADEQPKCAQEIGDATPLDFHRIENYAYDCKQFLSVDRWAVIGEAGAFVDPFYSPGSDFIAINNTLVSQLITQDVNGEDVRLNTLVYEAFYRSFVQHTQSLYVGQYGGFGDRQMMGVKLIWDYSYYWGVLAVMFIKQAITDVSTLRSINPLLFRAQKLNNTMQDAMRTRASKRLQLPTKGAFLDQYKVPCLHAFHHALTDACTLSVEQALMQNVELMEKIVPALLDMLGDNPAADVSDAEHLLLGDYRLSVLA